MDPNYIDPIIVDELRQDMEDESGEPIREGEIIEQFPEVFDYLQNHRDHEFIEDMYDDIGSDMNRAETVITAGEIPILVEDIEYNARQFEFGDYVEGFIGDKMDQEMLLRGQTFYEKYKTVDGLLGIKRKKYKVKDTSEGKLASELDKTVKFDKSQGRVHIKGQPEYQEPTTEWRGMFDD